MERFTWKAPDGTYQIEDYSAVSSPVSRTTCYDENFKNAFSIYEGSAIDKLGAYEDLEEQGLLIRLPCKVGDVVYSLRSYFDCDFHEDCEEYYKCEEDIPCEYEYKVYEVIETKFLIQMLAMIGKTVFLTKEEAEQALERRRDGKID